MSRPAVNWRSAEQSFRRIAAASLLFYAALALAVNLAETPRPEREDFTQFSPRIARLIVESARPVPPPPPPPAEPKSPEAEEVQVAKETAPAPPPPKGPSPEEIRGQEEAQRKKNMEVARKSGLLKLLNQNEPKGASGAEQEARLKNVFSEAGVLTRAPGSPGGAAPRASLPAGNIDELVSRLEKSVKAPGGTGGPAAGSGGIESIIASPRTESSAPAVKEHQTAAVRSPFQIKGSDGGEAARSQDSIAEVVDSYKGGISFLYNKALRENPTLRGTVTVEFVIAENGDVIDCRVVSSSMNNTAFEEALVKRLLQWKFPPVAAGKVTILYPIAFSVGG